MSVNWRQLASCREHDPETWFPHAGESSKRAAAVRICRSCPVIRDCAMYALQTQPPYGVWAGMTQKQLSTLLGVPASIRAASELRDLNRLTLQPCGTLAAYTRHYRNGETPCDACKQANARATSDKAAQR